MNENWTKYLELLLQGELSPEDSTKLQAELERNPEMRASLEQQKRVHEIAKRSGERKIIKGIRKHYHFQRTVKTSIISVVTAAVLATAAYFIVNHFSNKNIEQSEPVEGKYEQFDQKAELDNLPIHYFEHNGKDASFLSPKGILLSVPKKAFVLNGKPYKGKAVVQFQEAVDASDVVKAGLSTTSGDRLLETQGMFGLKAFTPDGRQLKVNDKDGVYIQVPVAENKAGMQLFDGVKNDKGEIDWQNPKPIEKLPVSANMLDLDLYPPGYEPTLDELKWHKKKEQRDSLYLSFEEKKFDDSRPFRRSDHGFVTLNCIDGFGNSVFGSAVGFPEYTYTQKLDITVRFDSKMKGRIVVEGNVHERFKVVKEKTNDFLPLKLDNTDIIIDAGEMIFSNNPKPNSFKRTYRFTLLTSNFIETNGVLDLTRFSRTNQMRAGTKVGVPFFLHFNSEEISGFNEAMDATKINLLPPSKVLSVWKKDFNGTILATRDFEKRMPFIHGACNEKVFDVYVNQINKPLWKLDEEVAKMGYPMFTDFSNERVGALKQDNAHMNILRQFYKSNIAKLRDKAKKDKNFRKAIEMEWDRTVRNERKDEKKRTTERETQAFEEEYDLNLKNVVKQLGKTVGVTIHGSGTVYNIDKYVRDATIARTSSVITDPDTGKTAQITYKDMTADIKDASSYGKLFMYLFPAELNSFQRINPTNGKFKYALNGDIQYDILFVGIKEEGYFIVDKKDVSEGDLGEIKLKSVSEKEFERRVEKMNSKRNSKLMSINSELTWLKTERKDYKVQAKRNKEKEFRNTIRGIIYPCGESRSDYYFYQESEKADNENPFL